MNVYFIECNYGERENSNIVPFASGTARAKLGRFIVEYLGEIRVAFWKDGNKWCYVVTSKLPSDEFIKLLYAVYSRDVVKVVHVAS